MKIELTEDKLNKDISYDNIDSIGAIYNYLHISCFAN